MKKILLFVIVLFPVVGWGQGTYYDESKHYQFRSMEDGPWEFKPEFYYYSWIYKDFLWWQIKLPGMGIHDRGPAAIGGGDKYVSNYTPNAPLRTEAAAAAALETPEYKQQSVSYDKVQQIEALLSADRTVDAVKGTLSSKFSSLMNTFIENMETYISNDGNSEKALLLWNQYYAIMESVNKINSAYLDNSKRLKAYQVEIEKLEELNVGMAGLVKMQYHAKENKPSFEIDRIEEAKKYFGNIKI